MITLQDRLRALRIVQIQTRVLFLLEFRGGAQIAYDCKPERFTLDLDIPPNQVRNILRDNQNDES